MSRSDNLQSGKNNIGSFFTIARFGPDSIVILGLLGITALVFYLLALPYLSVLVFATLVVIFCAESMETINLDRAHESRIIGARCLVVKKISKEERGIVRVYDSEGNLSYELWSAESQGSKSIAEGKTANIIGIRSIILQIEECSNNGSRLKAESGRPEAQVARSLP